MASKNIGERCITSRSCRSGFCSPTSGLCANPSLFQRCNAKASKDPCPSSQVCDSVTFRCLPASSLAKSKGKNGDRCHDVSECGASMACVSGKCSSTKTDGERCDEYEGQRSGPQCKDGTVCHDGICRDACYTLHGKDNPDWKCKNGDFKCIATGRGVQGVCTEAIAPPEPRQPEPEPKPITEPNKEPVPVKTQTKPKPWYQDNQTQLWIGMVAFLIFASILAISIAFYCVKRKQKRQKRKDIEGKKPNIPLTNPDIANVPIATLQSFAPSSSGMLMAPAMGPALPPSYNDVASTSGSLNVRMPSSTSLSSEKSEKHQESIALQTVPTAPESEDENVNASSTPQPRTPSKPPGSF